jgi:hypothetical protein
MVYGWSLCFGCITVASVLQVGFLKGKVSELCSHCRAENKVTCPQSLFEIFTVYFVLYCFITLSTSGVPRGGLGCSTPWNSEVLTKLSRISSSVENTSRNNLIRIRVSLICKLSGTPD